MLLAASASLLARVGRGLRVQAAGAGCGLAQGAGKIGGTISKVAERGCKHQFLLSEKCTCAENAQNLW